MLNAEELMDYQRAAKLLASPEIKTAVDWWTGQLFGAAFHDAGDVMVSGVANMAARGVTPLPKSQIEEFRLALSVALVLLVRNWDEANPQYGCALRCFGTDYHPDHILSGALAAAQIRSGNLRLPIKTLMWINPGEVTVAHGYGAHPEVLYRK